MFSRKASVVLGACVLVLVGSALAHPGPERVETTGRVHRPTLERLKADGLARGISLEQAIQDHVDRIVAAGGGRWNEWDEEGIVLPNLAIDDIDLAVLQDLKLVAATDGISLEEAIDRHAGQNRSHEFIDKGAGSGSG